MRKRLKYYIITLLFLIGIIGIFLITSSFTENHRKAYILLVIAGAYTLLISCILNLFYIFPIWKGIELLIPGIISVNGIILNYKDFNIDFLFFGSFALANLFLGMYWFVKERKLTSENAA